MKRQISLLIALGLIMGLILIPRFGPGIMLLTQTLYSAATDPFLYPKTTTFHAEKWKEPDLKYRYSVIEQLPRTIATNGMTKTQLSELLGIPDTTNDLGNWRYRTKRTGWSFLSTEVWILFSPDNLVTNVFAYTPES
jgi:hypothetical protein